MENKILQGDALTKLRELPEKSINMCMTSPPYWALRDYGVDGQLGLEPTFDQYISDLCDIFDGVKRVLRDDGTCWVNLGDTYYGSGAGTQKNLPKNPKCKESYTMPYLAHKHTQRNEWKRPSREAFSEAGIGKKCLECGKEIKTGSNGQFCSRECLNKQGNDFRSQNRLLPNKCLTMIPMRFAIEMVNRGWILRNVIIWHKPNCMPSSVKDRFTVDFEYIFFFSKKKKYYFETQYEDFANGSDVDYRKKLRAGKRYDLKEPYKNNVPYAVQPRDKEFVEYRNLPNLKELSKALNEERKRINLTVEDIEITLDSQAPHHWFSRESYPSVEDWNKLKDIGFKLPKFDKQMTEVFNKSSEKTSSPMGRNKRTVWSICPKPFKEAHFAVYPEELCETPIKAGCPVGGIVLDPFFGAGTTGLVALKQNKKFIGIELNKEYIEIATKRLKPFLEQTHLA